MGDNKKALHVSIVGGGISGLTAAIGLARLQSKAQITVYEIKAEPLDIGGALNLTPNALRILDQLGVLAVIQDRQYGANIGSIQLFDLYTADFSGAISFEGRSGNGHGKPPYKALRIMRGDLLKALLTAVAHYAHITVKYGNRVTAITETEAAVSITFSDNTTATSDILLGCDGIHSAVRTLLVDPSRSPVYSGIAVAFAFSPVNTQQTRRLFFKDTAVVTSRRGSFLASFFNAARDSLYIGGVMEQANVDSREGWKAKGEDQAQVKRDIEDRFGGSVIGEIDTIIKNAADWYLYPVFKLPPHGNWASKYARVMLLGDAAHAMPPQGESTGIALEDCMIFARLMALFPKHARSDIFAQYEKLRRPRVDAAYKEASFRWETVKDSGWIAHKLKSMLVPWFLWLTENKRAKGFEQNLQDLDLGLG